MKSSNRAVVAIVAAVVIAALAILSQFSSSGSTSSIGLSQDELNRLADKDLGAREKVAFAASAESRKEYLQQISEFFALANEALRRRLKESGDVKVLSDLGMAVALRQAYFDRHANDAQGNLGPGITPEEIDAWAAAHTADVERIKAALKTGDNPGPPIDGKQLAGVFLVAEKAKAEGLDKDPTVAPEVALQSKIVLVQILAGAAQEQIQKETEYSDEDVAAYFNAKAPTGLFDKVHAQHVLVSTRPLPSPFGQAAPAKTDDQAVAIARDVLQRARAGEDFAELAKQFSDEPGAKQSGGDLGNQALYNYVPEFAEAAASLQPGQISDVVKTEFGYHVIKVLAREPAEPLTPQVQARLKGQLSQRALERKVKEIVENHPPDIPEDFTVTPPAEIPEEPPQFQITPEQMMEMQEQMEEGDPHGDPHGGAPSAKPADAAPKPAPAPGKKTGADKPAGKSQ